MHPVPPPPDHWVHNLSPFVVQFTDTIGIRYYGLSYLLGFAGGGWLLYRAATAGRLRLPPAAIGDLMTSLVVGVLLGGRLGYFLLYDTATFLRAPWLLIQVWKGGMASHGGMIGVAVALSWFARKHRVPFLNLTDSVVVVAPLGLALGRIANFINGELWGKVSDWKWAVIFPQSARPDTPPAFIAPRHASQLYEAVLEGFLLLALGQCRYWRTSAPIKSPGRLSGEFLIAYAIVRSIGEIFREPDAELILGLSRGTFYSAFMILAGILVIWKSTPGNSTQPKQTPK